MCYDDLMRVLFTSKFLWSVAVVAIAIVTVVIKARGGINSSLDTYAVVRGDIRSEVSLSGRIKPITEINLAFLSSGRVSWIGVKVGDRVHKGQVLASLESSTLMAQLDQAKASLIIENSALDSMLSGSRPEDVEIARIKLDSVNQTLANKEVLLRDAASSAYVKSENAIHNYVDQFYSNPKANNTQFSIPISSEYELKLESDRPLIEDVLRNWQNKLVGNPDEQTLASVSREALSRLREFSSYLAQAVNAMTPSANISATVLAGYKTDISILRNTLETELTNVTGAIQTWADARSNLVLFEGQYNLTKSPSRNEDLVAQRARIIRAEAEISRLQQEIYRAAIYAPVTGLIARQDFEIGEIADSSDTKIRIISDKALSIEVNVAEADIVSISLGQEVEVRTDAYSSDIIFKALVTSIDPAETMVDGVSTYKVIISFLNEDGRLRAGMTANVIIVVGKNNGVLLVPSRFVNEKEGKDGAYVVGPGGKAEFRPIEIGFRGSDGRVEVLSGLEEKDVVIFIET